MLSVNTRFQAQRRNFHITSLVLTNMTRVLYRHLKLKLRIWKNLSMYLWVFGL